MNSEWACARDKAGLPIATSLWPDGKYTGVRRSQVESSEGYPGLVLAKQRPQAGWTDSTWLLCVCLHVCVHKLRQGILSLPTVGLFSCLLARVVDQSSCCSAVFIQCILIVQVLMLCYWYFYNSKHLMCSVHIYLYRAGFTIMQVL